MVAVNTGTVEEVPGTGTSLKILMIRVADPHHVNADLGSTFLFDADSDPTFHFNVDPDPFLLLTKVLQICHGTVPFIVMRIRIQLLKLMRIRIRNPAYDDF